MLTKQELDNIRAAVDGGAIKDELTAKLLDHIAELEENATAQALAPGAMTLRLVRTALLIYALYHIGVVILHLIRV